MQPLAISKYMIFKRRYNLSLVNKLGLALAMAFLTGIMAQIRIYLPFTPIPVTGQVFAVLLSGVICGGVFGSISQIIYIGLGILGVPWFATLLPSSSYLLTSPTAGYLIGFMVAPLLIGRYTDEHAGSRSLLSQVKIMMTAVVVINMFGAMALAYLMKLSFWSALLKGFAPFVLIDLFKAILAASLTSAILPRNPYNEASNKAE